MKSLIKRILNEELITEKLAMVDSDVDLLYDKYFSESIDLINKTGIITYYAFKPAKTDTSILQTSECIKAHNINPCIININNFQKVSSYNPIDNIITLNVSKNAINFILDHDGNLKDAISNLHLPSQKLSLSEEFTEHRIKGTIHHELAHWLDDTFHNKHIYNRINKQIQRDTRDLNDIPVNTTFMEIEGQIHNIKQYYNKNQDIWDTLTFEQLTSKIPALHATERSLSDGNEYKKKWLRNLKTRMYREGLLGDKMYN